jgi:hypothetical protein
MLRLMSSCVLFGVVGLCLAGCGPGGPKTCTVKGKLTIKGQPGKGVGIAFAPIDSKSQLASGATTADGSYELFTGNKGIPGAMLGKYKVVLSPPAAAAADPSQRYTQGGGPAKIDDSLVPTEWQSAATSPKEVEVKAGANEINIEL